MTEWIGWLATGIFAGSYFCRGPVALRIAQSTSAALWIAYGVLIGARPVIVSNVVVATLALVSIRRSLQKP